MSLLRVKSFLLAFQVMCLAGGCISKAASSKPNPAEKVLLGVWDSSRDKDGLVWRSVPLYVKTGCLCWAGYRINPVLSYQSRPRDLFSYQEGGYGKHQRTEKVNFLEADKAYYYFDGSRTIGWKASYYFDRDGRKIVIPS